MSVSDGDPGALASVQTVQPNTGGNGGGNGGGNNGGNNGGGGSNAQPVTQFIRDSGLINPRAIGMMVFLLSCVALLILATYSGLPAVAIDTTTQIDGRSAALSFDETATLRFMEVVMAVAGLGLITAFMIGSTNMIVNVVGFLVIAALIVPTRDIIRFTLIATGSEWSVEDYYSSATAITDLTSNVRDLSVQLVGTAERTLPDIVMSYDQRQKLQEAFVTDLRNDRINILYERTANRGALELLQGIANDQSADFLNRYDEIDRVEEDIRYLRSEMLITMAYDDLDSIEISELGQAVVDAALGLDTSLGEVDFVTEFNTNAGSGEQDCNRFAAIASYEVMDISGTGVIEFSNLADTPVRIFRVLPGEIGIYRFQLDQVDMANTPDVDPFLEVFSLGTGPDRPTDLGACMFLISDDDGGSDQLSSQLQIALNEGWYLVASLPYGGSQGPANLSWEKLD